MGRAAHLAKWIFAIIFGAGLAAVAFLYTSTEMRISRHYPVRPVRISAATDAGAVKRGEWLAQVTGCTGCHAKDLRGGVVADGGWLRGRYVAVNLTLRTATLSDADLARIIREGVRPDGRGVFFMPSAGFAHLTDAEMADLLAFIRSRPVGGPEQPGSFVGPLDRWAMLTDPFLTATEEVIDDRRKKMADPGPDHAVGRHLVAIACVECHGNDLKGRPWGPPDLIVAAGYDDAQFRRLMRTGIGADGKEHGLMTEVARGRFRHFSDDQVDAVYRYLVARALMPE